MWELVYPSLPLHLIDTSDVITLLFSLGEFALLWAIVFMINVAEKIILIISAGVFKVFIRVEESHVAPVADKTVINSGVKVIRTETPTKETE